MTKKFVVWLLSFTMIFSLCAVSVTVHAAASEEIVITSGMKQTGGSTDGTRRDVNANSFAAGVTGFAGKLSDDAVATITLSESTATDTAPIPLGTWAVSGSYPRYDIPHGFDFSSEQYATFSADVYADGDTVVGFSWHWSDFLKWDKDGKLYTMENSDPNDQYKIANVHVGTFERGRWHTIAVTVDSVANTHELYVDGTKVCTFNRVYNKEKHLNIKIGAYSGCGNGVIAIDEAYSYAGQYDASLESITITGDEKVSLSDGNIIYNEEAFADTASFKSYLRSISTANEITICDKSFSPVEGTLPQEGVCLMAPPSGIGYAVYNLQAKFFVSDVLSSSSDGQINVTANVTNNHAQAKSVTMIVALRDSAGTPARVYSSTTQTVLGTKSFAIENIALNGGTAHVFFIDDWSSLKAVSSQIIDVTNNSDT